MEIPRGFVTGVLCGGMIVTVIWGFTTWWKPERSPEDAAIYDYCLAGNGGNAVACDAFLRNLDRSRIKDAALRKVLNEGSAKMFASGASKRAVVQWAISMGAVGSQISDAAGITVQELQSDKY